MILACAGLCCLVLVLGVAGSCQLSVCWQSDNYLIPDADTDKDIHTDG